MKIEETSYSDVARAAVGMAKQVDRIRPDVIIEPLRNGCVTTKIVMEALRNNLGVPIREYDPPIFPVVLNYSLEGHGQVSREQLTRLKKTRENDVFKEFYPKMEKLMIMDYTTGGESVSSYLKNTLNEITSFGKEVFINLMATNLKERQRKEMKRRNLLHDRRLKFHFSRVKESIPFDNDASICLDSYVCEPDNFDYGPLGFGSNSELTQESLDCDVRRSKEFYKSVKEGLDERKKRDLPYRVLERRLVKLKNTLDKILD